MRHTESENFPNKRFKKLFFYEYKFTVENKNEQKKTFIRHLNT